MRHDDHADAGAIPGNGMGWFGVFDLSCSSDDVGWLAPCGCHDPIEISGLDDGLFDKWLALLNARKSKLGQIKGPEFTISDLL